jgi:hypothetical protein
MDLKLIETALLARLNAKITAKEAAVEVFPDDPKNYVLIHKHAAVLVHYEGSFYTPPQQKGTQVQGEEMRWGITILTHSLSVKDAGAYQLIEKVKKALVGYKVTPTGTGRAYLNKSHLLEEENSEWQYTVGISIPCLVILQNDNDPLAVVAAPTLTTTKTNQDATIDVTADGVLDWRVYGQNADVPIVDMAESPGMIDQQLLFPVPQGISIYPQPSGYGQTVEWSNGDQVASGSQKCEYFMGLVADGNGVLIEPGCKFTLTIDPKVGTELRARLYLGVLYAKLKVKVWIEGSDLDPVIHTIDDPYQDYCIEAIYKINDGVQRLKMEIYDLQANGQSFAMSWVHALTLSEV